MNYPTLRGVVALVLGVLVSGCMGSMERQSFCAETRCQQQRNQRIDTCVSDVELRCSECYDLYKDIIVSGGQVSGNPCNSVCDTSHCYRGECPPVEEDECARTGYRFSLPTTDSRVEEACRRAEARGTRCGEPTVQGHCEVNARVERPEAAAAYECIANTACGASTSDCNTELHPGTLGDEICARINQVCMGQYTCDPDSREAFNQWQGWLRDDVVSAGRSCLDEPSCEHVRTCLSAWVDTLLGEAPREGG